MIVSWIFLSFSIELTVGISPLAKKFVKRKTKPKNEKTNLLSKLIL